MNLKVNDMKIILSRKGFDSGNGGSASPILPDGTLLSMPIPAAGKSNLKYTDISYNGITYDEIWKQLSSRYKENQYCHLDPDIRSNIRSSEISNWMPAFGQINGANTHLENNSVRAGDLFLFFGWFRETEIAADGSLKYKKGTRDIHVIYGYLQITKCLKGKEVSQFSWHPHADKDFLNKNTNTLYLPSEKLSLNGIEYDIPGYGTLDYAKKLVLTVPGMSRTKWILPDWCRDVSISHHNKNSFKDKYFQSANIGQEFVIGDHPEAGAWATDLIIG